ncbi:amino acid adenylation domain-containing protein, partial [Pedobacter sp. P351]|uniref:non-ribosomal peptide synthetase n=1 Tax=Pedobacter superstes TaxID=3133441 RepID=UPI003099A14F
EAYTNQEVPFEKVVEAVAKDRDLIRNPIFQVMFILRNTPDVPELRLGNLNLSRASHQHTTSLFDLTLYFTETDHGLQGTIEYSTDLFEANTISRMAEHLKELLQSILTQPDQKIGSMNILPAREAILLSQFHTSSSAYPADKSILDLFLDQVKQRPESIAVVFGNDELTYKDLDDRSNQLAHYLQKKGVTEGMLIPVCVERSTEMIVSILGILKSGGAYVPLDPAYPDDRISFMLQDTEAGIVIISKANKAKLQTVPGIVLIEPDGADAAAIRAELSAEIKRKAEADQLAYVIYTSGSTGRPKGVLVNHRNVVSLVKGVDYVKLDEEDSLLVTGSPSFDATTFEYWAMLLNGGRLILCNEEELLDSVRLKNLIRENRVTTMWFTSSWFNQLMETDRFTFEGLKTILVGGEQLSEGHIRKFRKQHATIKLINGYGPTENTTFSLTYEIGDAVKGSIPIGRPLSNREAYVLDRYHKLLPIGVAGEICVGGAGLSRGYLHRPELTAEKFINHPFSQDGAARLYKTGDLGRWLPDGNLEYLGRMDEQVKIRGYRIEPGEIESVLVQGGFVRHAVVVTKSDGRSGKRLVGYVVATEEEFSKEKIQSYLITKLPEYMVPTLWVELAQIPLTANGKVDRDLLPEPEVNSQIGKGHTVPETEVEEKLLKIWQELLGVERIGMHDNFFELGGHSLMAMRIVAHIEKDFSVSIPIKLLFQLTTIRDLSRYIQLHMSSNSEQSTVAFKVLDV